MKHTKGEWVIDKDNTMVAILKDGVYKYIADCNPHHFSNSELDDEECEANAKLITASPDLLEACKDMLDTLEEQLTYDAKENEDIIMAIDKVTNAINKAEV